MSFRKNKEPAESNKFRSRSATASAPVYSKTPRAVKAIRVESAESDSDSSSEGSDEEEFRRKVCVTTVFDQVADPGEQRDRSLKTDRGRQIGTTIAISSDFRKPAHTVARKVMMIAYVGND